MKYMMIIIGLVLLGSTAMAQITPQAAQEAAAADVKVEEARQAAERLAAPATSAAGIQANQDADAAWDKMAESAEEVDGAVREDDLVTWGKWEEPSPRRRAPDGTYYVIDKATATFTLPEDDIDWLDLKKK